MTATNPFRQSWILTLAVVGLGIWLVVNASRVLGVMGSVFEAGGVGQTGVAGAVGTLVMLALLGLLLALYGEAGESDPAPEAWPPE